MRAYLSMWYRGPAGEDATDEAIEANIKMAVQVGVDIQKHFPSVDLYIPHIAQDLQEYNRLWALGEVGTSEILRACCEKVEGCDLFIMVGTPTEGMLLEYEQAKENGIECVCLDDWTNPQRYEMIAEAIWRVRN